MLGQGNKEMVKVRVSGGKLTVDRYCMPKVKERAKARMVRIVFLVVTSVVFLVVINEHNDANSINEEYVKREPIKRVSCKNFEVTIFICDCQLVQRTWSNP